jgi:ribonuclease P protein component
MDTGRINLITIKARRDFLTASRGKRWVTPRFVLLTVKRTDNHPIRDIARVGYTVTKKMGNAVARNRIKRRLRHAAAQVAPAHMKELHDYVIISREAVLTCEFSELLRDMEFAFSRIHANK